MSLIDFRFHFREGRGRPDRPPKIEVNAVSVRYGPKLALKGVSLVLHARETTAFIGPSGCGKTTLLRCFNRMIEEIPGARMSGEIRLDGSDIMDPEIEVAKYRARFGWVAQVPNPFPWSIHENVAYGARINGIVADRYEADEWVRACLERANLWNEVKDDLGMAGTDLSGGQQQRLCIARALASKPDVLLMDEPTASLDPTATKVIEDLVYDLSHTITVVVITHNLQQAARMAQRVAHFHLGELLEFGDTEEVLRHPRHPLTADFVGGRVG